MYTPNYYQWLDKPFTEEEIVDLDRIERKTAAGEELTCGESEQWPQLLIKKQRPADLARLVYRPDDNAFIQSYDRRKEGYQTLPEREHYAGQELKNAEAYFVERFAYLESYLDDIRRFDILNANLSRLYNEYQQHVAADLASFEGQTNVHNSMAIRTEIVALAVISIDFASYIKEEYREKLLPFLKTEYIGKRPQIVSCMLMALQDLGVLTISLKDNVTSLHKALTKLLGNVGSRQSLNQNLNNLNRANTKENLIIEAHRAIIKKHIEHV